MSSPRSFRRLCVFCGSSNQVAEPYFELARETARVLVERGIGVVYGGGSVGLMGAVADEALRLGGEVIGVIPEKLRDLELGHDGLSALHVVSGMHPRKKLMAQLSDGFIALPGGWGTLEELFEVITWTQLNYHHKPAGVVNFDGYYDHLLSFVDGCSREGFIRPAHRPLLCASPTPAGLLTELERVELPLLETWIADV